MTDPLPQQDISAQVIPAPTPAGKNNKTTKVVIIVAIVLVVVCLCIPGTVIAALSLAQSSLNSTFNAAQSAIQ